VILGKDLRAKIFEAVHFVERGTGLIYKDALGVLQKVKMAKKSLSGVDSISEKEIEQFIEQRKQAREEKNWAKSDLIRDELRDKGIILRDHPDGSVTWTFK
jgi:cysteinyl-tRNA synthetase